MKKLLVFCVYIAICVFSCADFERDNPYDPDSSKYDPNLVNGGNNLPGNGDNDAFSRTYAVTNNYSNETLDFSYWYNDEQQLTPLTILGQGTWEAKVTGSNLTLKLGTPNNYLQPIGNSSDELIVSNPDAKYFFLGNFCTQDERCLAYSDVYDDLLESVIFAYFDMDLDITGYTIDNYVTSYYNCNFKKGWNTMKYTAIDDYVTVTTDAPNNNTWSIYTHQD